MTPYQVLGVTEHSTEAQIKLAYRRAVRANHPDLGGNNEKLIAIIAAYKKLSSGPCTVCGGKGKIIQKRGAFRDLVPCPKCWETP